MESGSTAQPSAQRLSLGWSKLRWAKAAGAKVSEWEAKGDAQVTSGKVSDALDDYTKGLTENPNDLELWMKKADTFVALKRYRSALFCTDSALAKDGSRPDIWLMRGLLLHIAGDNETALEAINYSLSLKGDVLLAWALKAECLMDLERFEETRACIDLATDIDQKAPEILTLNSELERRIGESKKCQMCEKPVDKAGNACPMCELNIFIEDAQLNIQHAKDLGKSVPEAEELLSSARSLKEKGFGEQAIKAIKPLPDLFGKDWQNGAYALQIVDEAEDVSEALEADQMVGTISIREKTEKVRDALKAGQTVKAVVLARQALDLAKKIAQKYSILLLKDPERHKAKKPTSGPVCPNCGETVDPEWVKCPVCKKPLSPASPAPSSGPKLAVTSASAGEIAVTDGVSLYCPKCNEEVEDFWVKCMFCGTKLMGPKPGGG
jgi:tetratricopeptide (TPR) repeat protein